MKAPLQKNERGSTLVVTIGVVATILTLLGAAVGYTQHVSRMSDRTRKIAQAMEVGDGHLEFLFTHWRNISRAPGLRHTLKQPATNFFLTVDNPGPAPTPWTTNSPWPNPWPGAPSPIPRPPNTLFPDIPDYNLTEYRIQAVTPMIELDSTGNSTLGLSEWPPAAYGPNQWQYSYFYLASVDVTIPALNGNVTAKVRRVFEKKYDNPWTYAIFYHDDMEIHPEAALTIDGPIHTNSNLYISTSNLTVQDSTTQVRPPSKVSYAGEYLNGISPKDTSNRTGTTITKPNFPPRLPPTQDSPYLPFGWNLKLTNADGSVNNDSYHELIEPFEPCGESVDPLGEVRYHGQAGIKVLIVNPVLTHNVAAGATTVRVSNINGLQVGTVVQVGMSIPVVSNMPERRSITAIDCANKQLTLNSALSVAHAAGEVVQTGEFTTMNASLAGASTIVVANVGGLTVGDPIRIGVGTSVMESRTITNISNGNRQVTLNAALQHAHVLNDIVHVADLTVSNAAGTRVTASSSGNDKKIYDLLANSVSTRRSLWDYREGGSVRVADVDINKLTVAINSGSSILGFNGVLYISDTGAVVTNNPSTAVRRGIRLINGWALPVANSNNNQAGLTVVTENPAYIKGNYNTGDTNTNPPSNTNPASSPVVGTYGRRQAAVVADAITVLSDNWQDTYSSSTNRPSRPALSTTINAALVAGIVPSAGGNYSGGVESFIRLLEDWGDSSRTFCYWGSMVQLYTSVQANRPWTGTGNMYKSPVVSRYYWDPDFGKDPSDGRPYFGSPPGKLQIAAYLQQQRWYQVY